MTTVSLLFSLRENCQKLSAFSNITLSQQYLINRLSGFPRREDIKLRCAKSTLDVVFREDESRTRTRNSDDNLALLRKIALNLLGRHPSKQSLKNKRYSCAVNEEFLLSVLQS